MPASPTASPSSRWAAPFSACFHAPAPRRIRVLPSPRRLPPSISPTTPAPMPKSMKCSPWRRRPAVASSSRPAVPSGAAGMATSPTLTGMSGRWRTIRPFRSRKTARFRCPNDADQVMAYRKQLTRLKAPYLKRILLDPERVADWEKYPWNLPLFRGHDFELEFTTPITIIVGENGTGKSTLLEAIGALAGYDEAGGGKGYRPV